MRIASSNNELLRENFFCFNAYCCGIICLIVELVGHSIRDHIGLVMHIMMEVSEDLGLGPGTKMCASRVPVPRDTLSVLGCVRDTWGSRWSVSAIDWGRSRQGWLDIKVSIRACTYCARHAHAHTTHADNVLQRV